MNSDLPDIPASNVNVASPLPPRVPDHELIRRIGRGAYGEVWLARSVTGAFRAVKIVHRRSFDHDRPFEREFEGILKFEPISRRHDSQVDILHVGRGDDCFYYVMELADDQATGGQINPDNYTPRTLKSDLLFHSRLPFEECVRIGLALTTALENLHGNGLVHRDVKPSNIIFVNGVPKLADIGLVAGVDATRSYVGTEGFAAPEGPGSPQADLYSLGKVLYEISTGKDRQEFPDLPTRLRELPDREGLMELNAVIAKACRHDPKDRYASATAMRSDLELLQSGKSLARLHRAEKRLRMVQRAGAVVTVIAVIAAGLYLWQGRQTQALRQLANEKTELAEKNRVIAAEKTQLAKEKSSLADENRQRVVRFDVANGVRLLDEGDPLAALLWFADALPLVTNQPAQEEIHRIRIQQVLAETPQLLVSVACSNGALASAWSPDGKFFALVPTLLEESGWLWRIELYKSATGELLWSKPMGSRDRATKPQLRFSQDGRRLLLSTARPHGLATAGPATRGARNCALVLEAATGNETFPRAQSNLVWTGFSPDDRWLALAETNHVIRIVDALSGSPVVELKGHTNIITVLAFSANGNLLASASEDQTVRLWRLPSGEAVGTPIVYTQPVQRVVLSDEGHRLLTSTEFSETNKFCLVQLWDAQTGRQIGLPLRETNNVESLWFSRGAGDRFNFILIGPQKNVIEMRDSRTLELIRPSVDIYLDDFSCWEISRDDSKCLMGDIIGGVQTCNLESGKILQSKFRHPGSIQTIHDSPDGKRLLTTGMDGTAKIWSLEPETEPPQLVLPADLSDRPKEGGDIVRRGRTHGPIAIGLKDNKGLSLVDPNRLVLEETLTPQESGGVIYIWSAGSTGRFWAIGESRGIDDSNLPVTIDLWRKKATGFECLRLPHPKGVVFMGFAPDDSRLVSYCEDRSVRIWRTDNGKLERIVSLPSPLERLGIWRTDNGQPERITSLSSPLEHLGGGCGGMGANWWFLPNATAMLVFTDESRKHLQLFDLETGSVTDKPFTITTCVLGTFSPDSSRFGIVAGYNGSIFDLRTGELTTSFRHMPDDLRDLDWSPDGKRVVTAGFHGDVKLWDAATGEMLVPPMFRGHGGIGAARWSADGRFIITRSDDTARVWDASTAEAVTPRRRHSGYLRWACVTPGNRLITASEPNLLRAWDLKPTKVATEVMVDYAKFLSGRRLNASGALLPLKAEELAELNRSLHKRAPELFATP